MKKIYIIGTIHNKITQKELNLILEKFNPDQLLVEAVQRDLENNKFKKYPKEMVYAYMWGIKNKKITNGFDTPIDILKKHLSKKKMNFVEKQIWKIINRYDWKKWNKKSMDNYDKVNDLIAQIVDENKSKLRQKKMLSNIQKMMIKNGKILILTGSYHLRFFERNLKSAIFPFRKLQMNLE